MANERLPDVTVNAGGGGGGGLTVGELGKFTMGEGLDTIQVLMFDTDESNTFVGPSAGIALTNGFRNTGVGRECMSDLTEGDSNSAVGRRALENLTTGRGNCAFGERSGENLESGSNCIFIGEDTYADDPERNDAIVIGNDTDTAPYDGSCVISTNYVRQNTTASVLYYDTNNGEVTHGPASSNVRLVAAQDITAGDVIYLDNNGQARRFQPAWGLSDFTVATYDALEASRKTVGWDNINKILLFSYCKSTISNDYYLKAFQMNGNGEVIRESAEYVIVVGQPSVNEIKLVSCGGKWAYFMRVDGDGITWFVTEINISIIEGEIAFSNSGPFDTGFAASVSRQIDAICLPVTNQVVVGVFNDDVVECEIYVVDLLGVLTPPASTLIGGIGLDSIDGRSIKLAYYSVVDSNAARTDRLVINVTNTIHHWNIYTDAYFSSEFRPPYIEGLAAEAEIYAAGFHYKDLYAHWIRNELTDESAVPSRTTYMTLFDLKKNAPLRSLDIKLPFEADNSDYSIYHGVNLFAYLSNLNYAYSGIITYEIKDNQYVEKYEYRHPRKWFNSFLLSSDLKYPKFMFEDTDNGIYYVAFVAAGSIDGSPDVPNFIFSRFAPNDYENRLGIAQNSVDQGDLVTVTTKGGVSAIHDGLETGSKCYIDSTNPRLVTGDGLRNQFLGVAISPTEILLM